MRALQVIFLSLVALVGAAMLTHPAPAKATGTLGYGYGPTAGPTGTPTPPAAGIYTTADPIGGIGAVETEYAQIASDGYTYIINFGNVTADETGPNSLTALLAYDATIGIHEFINIKDGTINDPVNPLTGTCFITPGPGCAGRAQQLASDCGASNNEQTLSCIATICNAASACAGYYFYDEPGCPDQGIGYCAGSIGTSNYNNVNTIAAYMAGISSKPVVGYQTPSGVPSTNCGGTGGWTGTCAQVQINDLFSCTSVQTTCFGIYPWITSSGTPYTGYDSYPYCQNSGLAFASWTVQTGTLCVNQFPSDAYHEAVLIANTIAANYAPEVLHGFVAQGFSWGPDQEAGSGCTSEVVCPMPDQNQMQYQHDLVTYGAWSSGKPIQIYWVYYWPDLSCINTYSGCNGTAFRAAMSAVIHSPVALTMPTNPP